MNLFNQEFQINNERFFSNLKRDQEQFQVFLFRNNEEFRQVQEQIYFQTDQKINQTILQFLLNIIIDQPLPIQVQNKNTNFKLDKASLNFLYYFLNISVLVDRKKKIMKPMLPQELCNDYLKQQMKNIKEETFTKSKQVILNILKLDSFIKTYQFYQLVDVLIKDRDNIFWKNYEEFYINKSSLLQTVQKIEEPQRNFEVPKMIQMKEDRKLELDFCQNIIVTENQHCCHMAIYDQNLIYDYYYATKLCQNKKICFKGLINEAKDMLYGDIYQGNNDLVYRGSFQYNRPHGKGFQRLRINESQIIYEGNFFFGFKQGEFKVYDEGQEELYEITQFQKGSEEETKKPFEIYYIIASTQQQQLNHSSMNTLIPGRWLQEKVVDFFLEKCTNYYYIIQEKQIGQKIGLFNCLDWQDIFGSQIVISESYKNNSVNPNQLNRIIKMNYNRTIFAINHQRSHFQVIVIENDKNVYLLNSMQSSDDRDLIEFIVSCCPNELNYKIDSFEVNVPQQRNAYDCGVHTCYNIIKLIENDNQQIHEIDFSIQGNNLKKFRRFIYDIVMNQIDLTQIKQK